MVMADDKILAGGGHFKDGIGSPVTLLEPHEHSLEQLQSRSKHARSCVELLDECAGHPSTEYQKLHLQLAQAM